jgi:glycosyltransferase involved in cell wall biosynthesis
MITVLMPVYNAGKFLDSSIKSILLQSYKDFEFLILDDGSTDDSEEKVKSYTDSRIKFIKLPRRGMGDALNYGLSIAKYNWIARMDADDLAHPNRLERQLKFISNNANYHLVSSWYALFSDEKIISIFDLPEKHKEIKKHLALHSPICHPGSLYNRKIIPPEGFSNSPFADYEMWLKIMNHFKFYVIPEILIFVRYRKDSFSRGNISSKYKMIYEIQKTYYNKSFRNYFGIETENSEYEIRGWREYFYGRKHLALKYWMAMNIKLLTLPRVILAVVTTILPGKYFIRFKELRMKYRMKYLLGYFSSENKKIRATFFMMNSSDN